MDPQTSYELLKQLFFVRRLQKLFSQAPLMGPHFKMRRGEFNSPVP
jgi:hypothetical protein